MRHFTRGPKPTFTFDLHVLSMPPAFVLSQDQTLQLFKLQRLILLRFDLCCPQTISSVCYLVFKDPVAANSQPHRAEGKHTHFQLLKVTAPPQGGGAFAINFGGVLLSHMVPHAVSSAL